MTYRIQVWVPSGDERSFLEQLISVGVSLTPNVVKRLDPDPETGSARFVITRITEPQIELLFQNGATGWAHTSSPNDDTDDLMDEIHRFLNPTPA